MRAQRLQCVALKLTQLSLSPDFNSKYFSTQKKVISTHCLQILCNYFLKTCFNTLDHFCTPTRWNARYSRVSRTPASMSLRWRKTTAPRWSSWEPGEWAQSAERSWAASVTTWCIMRIVRCSLPGTELFCIFVAIVTRCNYICCHSNAMHCSRIVFDRIYKIINTLQGSLYVDLMKEFI